MNIDSKELENLIKLFKKSKFGMGYTNCCKFNEIVAADNLNIN